MVQSTQQCIRKLANIFFCTVHFREKLWAELQDHYINKFTNTEFQVIAITSTNIYPNLPNQWIKIRDNEIKDHGKKLNIAGDIACNIASEDDIIVFIDSDCFPISNWCDQITRHLDENRIVAVQRLENDGDPQPHPSFTCMKAKTWKLIKGDWRKGYEWNDSNGEKISDVGANILKKLNQEKISWHKIYRSNTYNPHPLFFGIYGSIVYHHGAGSREPISRADHKELRMNYESSLEKGGNYETLVEERIINNKEMSDYYLKEIMNGVNPLNLFQN